MGWLSKKWKKVKKTGSKVWSKIKKPVLYGAAALGTAGLAGVGPAAGMFAGAGGKFAAGAGKLFSSAKGAATAIGGFASRHSRLIGAGAGLIGQQMANTASAQQAGRQMDFQERMSSTAHQRQVEDLKAAGLNPILSANAGASAPGGAMGQVGNIGEAGVSSAVNAARNKAEVDNLREQNNLIRAQKNQTDAGTANIAQQTQWFPYMTSAQIDAAMAGASSARAQALLSSGQFRRVTQDADFYASPAGSWALGQHLSGGGVGGLVGGAASTAQDIARWMRGRATPGSRRPPFPSPSGRRSGGQMNRRRR